MTPEATAKTPLSQLRRIVAARRSTAQFISPEMVRSIQQSMAVEGYPVTEAVILAEARRLLPR